MVSYLNYYPIGDISAMALCILIFILLLGTFVNKNWQFKLFVLNVLFVFLGTITSLMYHTLLSSCGRAGEAVIFMLRDMSVFFNLLSLLIYIHYILDLVSVSGKEKKTVLTVSYAGMSIFLLTEVLGNIFGFGFHMDDNGMASTGFNMYGLSYLFFVGVVFYLLMRYRNRMIPQIIRGIVLVFMLCILMFFIQGIHSQSSYSSVIFLMPVVGIMYMLHSNPFNITTGAVGEESFLPAVAEAVRKKERFMLMYLDMLQTNIQHAFTPQMRFEIYRFYRGSVKKPILFHVGANQLILMFKEKDNPDPEARVRDVVANFEELHKRFGLDFKAIMMEDNEEINRHNSYIEFLSFVEGRAKVNEYYYVGEEDIDKYNDQCKVLDELKDIAEKKDPDDARVLVYCQPVYNVDEGIYDTAEALMRLELEEFGIVSPAIFIPLAEKYNLIHELSLIILNKVCKAVSLFISEGLRLKRISVNFSMQEVREPEFCGSIIDIIKKNGIPYEKIAIEITESRNERDFEMVKGKIEELRDYGIKFYLDDFGTGYSNFERIMELPFDIIKFDRSMVIESGKSEASTYMVYTFASMFREMDYRVLYEGIESDGDEERCINMWAQYLQGFKYSKPIPIEGLRDFLNCR